MKRFNIHAWRQKQLIESYNNRLSDQILNQLFEELIPQDVLLNEGIGDFLSGLKDKIKNTKAFTSLISLATDFKDSSKAITFALRLNALGILPKNEAELQILKDKLEGNKTKVNEQETEYNNKLNSELPEGDKDTEELKSFWHDTFAGKTIKTIFVFFMIFQMNAASIMDTVKTISPDSFKTVQTQAGVSDINLAGVSNKLADAGFDNDQIKDIIAGIGDIKLGNIYNLGGDVKIFVDSDGNVEVETPDDIDDPGELSSETDNISKAADQGLKLNISGEQTANFSLFDYGSSNLTQAGESEADTENDKIIDYLINGQDYSETIIGQSSNTGPNSNYDNSTNEADKLDANRANALADYSLDDIKRGLDDKGVKYTSTDTTITLEDGTKYTQNVETGQNPESLNQIDKTDDTPTQSAIRVGEVETTDPPTNVVLVDFNPVAAPAGGSMGTSIFTPPSIESFGNLIREAQIASIMALSKPELSLFPYLNAIKHGKEENESLGGYTQSSFKSIKDNESLPQEIRTLAGAVMNVRRKPDPFISKIGDILGVEFSKRAKAIQLAPGQAGMGQQIVGFTPISEILHPLYEFLNEQTSIEQFLDSINIKKNAGQILAYIGSMYASKDNTQVGIVNADNLPSHIKSQLDKAGFEPSSIGRDKGIYVFMDDGEQSPVKGIPDKISKPISLDIDPETIKKGQIFISPKNTPIFPKELYKTQFYKDAVKDGWMFVDRKDVSYLPKGTKVKVFPIDSIDKVQNTNYSKVKNLLKEKQTKMKNLLKERFQKLAGIKSLHEVTIDDKSWPGIEQDFDNMSIPDMKDTDMEDNTLNFNPETKTMTSMAELFLTISKRLRRGEFKGLNTAELEEMGGLIMMILQAAEEGNLTTIMQRMKGIVGKSIKGYEKQ